MIDITIIGIVNQGNDYWFIMDKITAGDGQLRGGYYAGCYLVEEAAHGQPLN
jgi:hypothetical protein